MNREIKFRGKRTDNGKWVYGSYHTCIGEAGIRKFEHGKREATIEKHDLNKHWILVHQTPDSMGWSMRDTYHAYEVVPESVGQLTGLKDKDGKDIYENDHDEDYQVVRWCDKKNGWAMATIDFPTNDFILCNCYNCEGHYEIDEAPITITGIFIPKSKTK